MPSGSRPLVERLHTPSPDNKGRGSVFDLISSQPADRCSTRCQSESDALDAVRQPSFRKAFASKNDHPWTDRRPHHAHARRVQLPDRSAASCPDRRRRLQTKLCGFNDVLPHLVHRITAGEASRQFRNSNRVPATAFGKNLGRKHTTFCFKRNLHRISQQPPSLFPQFGKRCTPRGPFGVQRTQRWR